MRRVSDTAPLWRMGKRKKPPKLPQRAVGNTRLLYARVTTYQPDEILAAAATADVLVLNWGLHYQKMDDYRRDLHAAFEVLNKLAATPGKAVLFSETGTRPPPPATTPARTRRVHTHTRRLRLHASRRRRAALQGERRARLHDGRVGAPRQVRRRLVHMQAH